MATLNVKSVIEAVLFVVGAQGIKAEQLKQITRVSEADLQAIIQEMMYEYEKDPQHGIMLVHTNGCYKIVTKPAVVKVIDKYFANNTPKIHLNQAMIETLAIIAYNEPCSKSQIWQLRKTDPTPVINKLLELGLLQEAGRGVTVGKPYLYQVTGKFYEIFGINSIHDLPKITIPTAAGLRTSEEEEENAANSGQKTTVATNFFDINRKEQS